MEHCPKICVIGYLDFRNDDKIWTDKKKLTFFDKTQVNTVNRKIMENWKLGTQSLF